ncbi:thiol-dependent ubiquitin-specific protease [Aureococcus anophagefferens]|nr:thiol-dependent ubiquitin-specific protease [Aureococcus anophagefferens]
MLQWHEFLCCGEGAGEGDTTAGPVEVPLDEDDHESEGGIAGLAAGGMSGMTGVQFDGGKGSRGRVVPLELLAIKAVHLGKDDADREAVVGQRREPARLGTLNLSQHMMQGDGNCQFRAFAFNLFGTQSHHLVVRRAACEQMAAHVEYFAAFFADEAEFRDYLRGMARDRTWGDELTLRAVVEAYGCVAHVLTSEAQNWYLVYTPESTDVDLAASSVPENYQAPPQGKEVFLSYVSPVHYNAVVASVAKGAYGEAPPTPRPIDRRGCPFGPWSGLDETNAGDDPLRLFQRWFDKAVAAKLLEPNALTLTTVDAATMQPSSRVVLLKGFDESGFTFYTNYAGRKASEMAATPKAAMNFLWLPLERQGKQSRLHDRIAFRAADAGAWTRERLAP